MTNQRVILGAYLMGIAVGWDINIILLWKPEYGYRWTGWVALCVFLIGAAMSAWPVKK